MRPETGLLLRVIGPAIQIVCMALLLTFRGRGVRIGRVHLEALLVGGFALGFLLVLAGITLARKPRLPRRSLDLDLDRRG